MKHLTDEQKERLRSVVENLIYSAAWGFDMEIDEDNLDEVIQSELIEPFIEPLINGEL